MTERLRPGEEIGLRGPFPRNVRLGESGRGVMYKAGEQFNLKQVWQESESIKDRQPLGTFDSIFIRERYGNLRFLTQISSQGDVLELSYDENDYRWFRFYGVEELLENSQVFEIKEDEYVNEERTATEIVIKKHGVFSNDSERALKTPESKIENDFNLLYAEFLTEST